jgi:hypothetical protein
VAGSAYRDKENAHKRAVAENLNLTKLKYCLSLFFGAACTAQKVTAYVSSFFYFCSFYVLLGPGLALYGRLPPPGRTDRAVDAAIPRARGQTRSAPRRGRLKPDRTGIAPDARHPPRPSVRGEAIEQESRASTETLTKE